jgi:hypothetical protein
MSVDLDKMMDYDGVRAADCEAPGLCPYRIYAQRLAPDNTGVAPVCPQCQPLLATLLTQDRRLREEWRREDDARTLRAGLRGLAWVGPL